MSNEKINETKAAEALSENKLENVSGGAESGNKTPVCPICHGKMVYSSGNEGVQNTSEKWVCPKCSNSANLIL